MKSLLFVIALTCAFIAICLGVISGVRTGPMLGRAAIVFVTTYGIGLLAGLLAFVSLLSSGSGGRHTTVRTIKSTGSGTGTGPDETGAVEE